MLSITFQYDLWPILVVISIAWLVPFAMSLLNLHRVHSVIIEIIAGFLAGQFLLTDLGPANLQILEFLSLMGLLFLMFLGGLEIDIEQVFSSLTSRNLSPSRISSNPLISGTMYFLLTLLITWLGVLVLAEYFPVSDRFFFTLVLSTTSVAIILTLLKNRGETGTPHGQVILTSAAINRLAWVIIFTFYVSSVKGGITNKIFLVFLLFAVFYAFYLLGQKWRFNRLRQINFQLAHAASQITTRGVMFIMGLFIVIAQLAGSETMILGAFMAGLLVSFFLQKERSLLMLKLDSMGYGFFIPFFFIMVGVTFDVDALKEFDRSLFPFLLAGLAIMVLSKVIPALIWIPKYGPRKSLGAAFLMVSQLSLIIAASSVGLQIGLLSPGMHASFVILAVVTSIASPIIYEYLIPLRTYRDKKVIIVGGSSTGVLLARRLKMLGKACLIVEKEPARYEDILSKGIGVVQGDGNDLDFMMSLGIRLGDQVVVLTGNDEDNYRISKLVRQDMGIIKVVSVSGLSSISRELIRIDVEVMDIRLALASTLENLLMRPGTYKTFMESFDNFVVEEISVTGGAAYGHLVRELPWHKDCMLMLARRGDEVYVPHGESYLKSGDILTIFGTSTAISRARDMLARDDRPG